MTDLLRVLPAFPASRYNALLPALEKHQITTTDLLTLDSADLGKRTQLPLLDLQRLCAAVLRALHADVGVAVGVGAGGTEKAPAQREAGQRAEHEIPQPVLSTAPRFITTLSPDLDTLLGGGISTHQITELVGESGSGKTQLLLTLLLSVQLPPHLGGLGRPAVYISTESSLSTRRLSQILHHHPRLRSLAKTHLPSLDGVISTATPDLESQDHILSFQVPVVAERRNVGLLVLDSVAANFRAEFERGGRGMLARTGELTRLGGQLRDLARRHGLAVVVANQVADRFGPEESAPSLGLSLSGDAFSRNKVDAAFSHARPRDEHILPMPSLSRRGSTPPLPNPLDNSSTSPAIAALTLDRQQRWFTGWGDSPVPAPAVALKTPSLGLVWAQQLGCRIALYKCAAGVKRSYQADEEEGGEVEVHTQSWRRWLRVVFAGHVGAGRPPGWEFAIGMGGLVRVEPTDLGHGE